MFNTHYLIKVSKGLALDPAWHTTSVELGSHQPASQRAGESDKALPVGCHTETIVWTALGRRLWKLLQCPPADSIHQFVLSLILHRHSQSYSQRRCLGNTSFFLYGDRRVHSVPRFQPGIDLFIGNTSRNGKMPVYRAPCICSPIHQDTTISMIRGPSAKPFPTARPTAFFARPHLAQTKNVCSRSSTGELQYHQTIYENLLKTWLILEIKFHLEFAIFKVKGVCGNCFTIFFMFSA